MQVKVKSVTALVLSLVLAFATLIGGMGFEPAQAYAEETLSDGVYIYLNGENVTGTDGTFYCKVESSYSLTLKKVENGQATDLDVSADTVSVEGDAITTDVYSEKAVAPTAAMIGHEADLVAVSGDYSARVHIKCTVPSVAVEVSGDNIPSHRQRVIIRYGNASIANYAKQNATVVSGNQSVLADDAITPAPGTTSANAIWNMYPNSVGTTTLTLTLDDMTWSYDMTIAVDSVFIPKGDFAPHYIVQPEASLTIPCFTPEGVSSEDLTWTSSDEEVAVVDQDGKVTGVFNGRATITAQASNGQSDSAVVQVIKDGVYRLDTYSTDIMATAGKTPVNRVELSAGDKFIFTAWKDGQRVQQRTYTSDTNVIAPTIAADGEWAYDWSPVANGSAKLYICNPVKEEGWVNPTALDVVGVIDVTVTGMDTDAPDPRDNWTVVEDGKTASSSDFAGRITLTLKDQEMQVNPANTFAKDNYLSSPVDYNGSVWNFEVKTGNAWNLSDDKVALLKTDEYNALYQEGLKRFIHLDDAAGNVIATPDDGLTVTTKTDADPDRKCPVADVTVKVDKELKAAQEYGYTLVFDWFFPVPRENNSIETMTLDYSGFSPTVVYHFSTTEDPAVVDVEDMIDALPDEITIDDVEAVTEAKEAYDALTDEQKAQVDADLAEKLDGAVEKAAEVAAAAAAEAADVRDEAVPVLAQLNSLVNADQYKADSYKAYADAYTAFITLAKNEKARASELKAARTAVIKAYLNLEEKDAQKMTVKAAVKKVKATKVKKAKQTVAPLTVKDAKGTVTYKKAGGAKQLTISAKTGKVTVKKGTKKGTYKIKVKVTAAGDQNYKAMSKTVTATVKVVK